MTVDGAYLPCLPHLCCHPQIIRYAESLSNLREALREAAMAALRTRVLLLSDGLTSLFDFEVLAVLSVLSALYVSPVLSVLSFFSVLCVSSVLSDRLTSSFFYLFLYPLLWLTSSIFPSFLHLCYTLFINCPIASQQAVF
jgi:hypothetical protein